MNASLLLRAVRGPLVLILVGTLFALDHFANLSFDRTWPVLIIMIGAWKLLEYVVGRPAHPGPPPVGRINS
jgi:hypothetical protein